MKTPSSFELVSVEITGNNSVTIAEITYKVDGLILSVTGSARRHPEDSFNSAVGENLAISRAFASLGRKLEKRTIGRTRHIEMFLSKNARKRAALKRSVQQHKEAVLSIPNSTATPRPSSITTTSSLPEDLLVKL